MDNRDTSIIEAAWAVAERLADEGTGNVTEAAEIARAALGALLDAMAANPAADPLADGAAPPAPCEVPNAHMPAWSRAIWEGGSAVPT